MTSQISEKVSPQGDGIPGSFEITPAQEQLLRHLAELRQEELREQNAFVKSAALRRRDIGRALAQLRKTFPRTKGNCFYPVVERRTGLKRATAAAYIHFADHWPVIQAALADADDTEEIPSSLKELVNWALRRNAGPVSEEVAQERAAKQAAQAHPLHRANSSLLAAVSTFRRRIQNADDLVPQDVIEALRYVEQWAAAANQQLEESAAEQGAKVRPRWSPPASGPLATITPIAEVKAGCLLERYPLTEEGCRQWETDLVAAGLVGAALARRLGVSANSVSQHGKRVRQFLEQEEVG